MNIMDENENKLISEITKVCKIKLKMNRDGRGCVTPNQFLSDFQ